jgi:hypothetical protein
VHGGLDGKGGFLVHPLEKPIEEITVKVLDDKDGCVEASQLG